MRKARVAELLLSYCLPLAQDSGPHRDGGSRLHVTLVLAFFLPFAPSLSGLTLGGGGGKKSRA